MSYVDESMFNGINVISRFRQLAKPRVGEVNWIHHQCLLLLETADTRKLKFLSTSKQRKWKAKYLPEKWKRLYSWIVKVVVEKGVIGILCSICQQPGNYDTFDGQQQQWRSGWKFVNVLHCNIRNLFEQAQTHKFGSIHTIDPVSQRGNCRRIGTSTWDSTYEIFPDQKNSRQCGNKRNINMQHDE